MTEHSLPVEVRGQKARVWSKISLELGALSQTQNGSDVGRRVGQGFGQGSQ